MDPLADVLRSVRLAGGIFLDARFTAPWSVSSRITPDDCRPFLFPPAQVVAYHVVIEGRLLVSLENGPTIEVNSGEIVLLPRNDPHTLSSENGIAPINADDLMQPSEAGGLARISYGGGGSPTHLFCGFFGSEEVPNPLIANLPRVLKLGIGEAASREWIEASVRFVAAELVAGRAASSDVVSRLCELLLVEAVRSYAASLDQHQRGWLKGMSDPHIGRALASLHGAVSSPWSVEQLAREAALSRSTFVERFTSVTGMPPIRYLIYWRLQAAQLQLRETRRSVAQIAHSVGYDSEEAFSRAFKRELRVSPARWREARHEISWSGFR
jgi:AraC-like DNA-binding protein